MSKCANAGMIMLAASAAMAATPVLARDAGRLQGLVGMRGSSGEVEMERQGFTYIDGHQGSKYAHTYWWHPRDKNCIEVKTYDGRYDQIVDAANKDCNQKSGGSSAGAAVAGAAVGALLVAAIASSHKSSHHDDGRHYDDHEHERQYDRGYSDGLYNAAYHNYDRSDHYADGYRAGVSQRLRNTSYHSGHGGYAPRRH